MAGISFPNIRHTDPGSFVYSRKGEEETSVLECASVAYRLSRLRMYATRTPAIPFLDISVKESTQRSMKVGSSVVLHRYLPKRTGMKHG